MRNLIFTSALLLSLPLMGAEGDYTPLVQQGKVWRYAGYCHEYGYMYRHEYFKPVEIRLDGEETLANGKTYAKGYFSIDEGEYPSYKPNSPSFYLREDVESKKVWVVYEDNMPFPLHPLIEVEEDEYLLYDFNDPMASQVLYGRENPDCEPYEQIEGIGITGAPLEWYNYPYLFSYLVGKDYLFLTAMFRTDGPLPVLYEVVDAEGNVLYSDDERKALLDYDVETDDRNQDVEGVATVEADNSAPVEYFNMQGVRVDNPQPGQLLIRRQGATATKVIIK